ncbi:unnamed protein product, partial [Timema podura]|nr:unnamed protein product [Timema podura]
MTQLAGIKAHKEIHIGYTFNGVLEKLRDTYYKSNVALIKPGEQSGGNIGPDTYFAIVKRSSWGARTADLPSELRIPHTPVDYIIIIHTDTTICNTSASCVNQMRALQNNSMDKKHLSDIPYNFLIGGDGNVYEGRGFKIQGAFVPKWNIKSFGLAFI